MSDQSRKTTLYILGLLLQRGPQHGYALRGTIEREVADFAHIKPPTLYYHLRRLEKQGLVRSRAEQVGRRPERSVYEITEQGRQAFGSLAEQALEGPFWGEFLVDAAFYFGGLLGRDRLLQALQERLAVQQRALAQLRQHQQEVLCQLQGFQQLGASAIFQHHLLHQEAETRWLQQTIDALQSATGQERI